MGRFAFPHLVFKIYKDPGLAADPLNLQLPGQEKGNTAPAVLPGNTATAPLRYSKAEGQDIISLSITREGAQYKTL